MPALVFRRLGRRSVVEAIVAAALAAAACQPIGGGAGGGGTPGAETADVGGTAAATGTAGASPATSPSGAGGAVTQLTIATGGTGGVYYPLGGGFAEVIRKYVPGHDATVQETNASVDNMQLIQNGGADLALVLADTAGDAVNGAADFEGNPVEACTLGRLYNNFTQVVTSRDSGIASIEDLRGKRVSLGSPGSGTEIIALRILEAAGLDPDADIDRQQLGVDETVAALRDGTIDAGFWSGGLPTGALVDYATTGDMALIPTAEYTSAVAEQYGEAYLEDVIPAGTYEGQDEEVPTIVVPNLLVVNTSMSEDLQRQITAAIFEHKDELVQVHPAAGELDAGTAGDVTFMEVCPGARAFFDEQG